MNHCRALLLTGASIGAIISISLSLILTLACNLSNESHLSFLSTVNFFRNFVSDKTPNHHHHERTQNQHFGKYKDIRGQLDYTFHHNYSEDRIVLLQDEIIDSMLETNATDTTECNQDLQQWLVFTAGAMGAGKSYTIKLLQRKWRFPLQAFIIVDPDRIRHHIPEFETYIEQDPENAGERTRKEAGLIAEVLTEAALQRGLNVLVDGSLRDAKWYQKYITATQQKYPQLSLAIIHITAPRNVLFANALVSLTIESFSLS